MKNPNSTGYKTNTEKILFAMVFTVLSIYAFTMLYAFGWAILSSLKTKNDFYFNPLGLPTSLQFSNYITAFVQLGTETSSMLVLLFNSLWLTIGGAIINVFVCAMTAYVIAKYNFKFKKFLYSLALFIMLIPIVGALPASYKLMSFLGILDTPLMLLTFAGGFGFNFFVLYGFFSNLPWAYAESAFIDGASHYKVFGAIMLPLAKGPLLSVALLQVIGIWNDYFFPLIYLPNYPTLSSGLYSFEAISKFNRVLTEPIYFAGIILAMLPILILFLIFQKTMMKSIVAGGLKG